MRWLLCILIVGCQLGPFDDLEKQATLLSFEPPSRYTDFGGVIAAYTGGTATEPSRPISRIVASRGVGFGQVVFNVFDEEGLGGGKALTERCNNLGGDMPDCPMGASGAVVGLASWNGLRDCYLTSNVDPVRGDDSFESGEGELLVMCEQSRATMRILPVEEVDLGTDLAPLPEDHVAGVALISATRTPEGGQIFRLNDGGAMPVPLANPTGFTLSADGALGSPLETFPVDSFGGLGSPVIVAAGAPGDNRVVLMVLGDNAGTIELQTLGCVDGVTTRAPRDNEITTSGEIALGNIDGDAAIEVVIGDPTSDRVLIAEVPSVVGTCDTPLATTELACPASATGTLDASCAAASFGAALAIGDINNDGMSDVVVGAPTADVGGDVDSGALYVIPGTSSGPDADAARVLVPSGVGPEDFLGRSVVLATTNPGCPGDSRCAPEATERLEPVASAPGENAVFMFLCTGLPGDVPTEEIPKCVVEPE